MKHLTGTPVLSILDIYLYKVGVVHRANLEVLLLLLVVLLRQQRLAKQANRFELLRDNMVALHTVDRY